MAQAKTVVVTRPQEQSQALVEALQQAGASVLLLPTLAIDPIPIDYPQKAFVLDLDRYSIVICVSANAARIGLDVLSDYWPQWPVAQQWFAVGPATGQAMGEWGLNLKTAEQGSTSETLLDWPELQNLHGQRVLILRGEGGRETLAETLRTRGAQVDYLELYRRVMPQVNPAPLIEKLQQGQRVILTVTSGDGLRNLMALVGDGQLSALCRCPMVVVSGRLAEFAQSLGFDSVLTADSPNTDDMIHCIQNA